MPWVSFDDFAIINNVFKTVKMKMSVSNLCKQQKKKPLSGADKYSRKTGRKKITLQCQQPKKLSLPDTD